MFLYFVSTFSQYKSFLHLHTQQLLFSFTAVGRATICTKSDAQEYLGKLIEGDKNNLNPLDNITMESFGSSGSRK